MYIGDLEEGATIDILVKSGDKKVTLNTTCHIADNATDQKLVLHFFRKYQYGSGIMANVIARNGKFIGFNTLADASINILSVNEKHPYVWSDVKIITANFKKGTYYLIMSNQNAKELNRRSSFRQWIGHDGNLKMGLSAGSNAVVIRDISTTGVGIIVRSDLVEPRIGEMVHITYSDKVNDGIFDKEFNFSLNAFVARKEIVDGNRTIIGCRFEKPNESIGKYINLKQTEHKKVERKPMTRKSLEQMKAAQSIRRR